VYPAQCRRWFAMHRNASGLGCVPELAMAAAHRDDVPTIVTQEFENVADLRRHTGINGHPTSAMTLTSCCLTI
jgi:hypothetical protein